MKEVFTGILILIFFSSLFSQESSQAAPIHQLKNGALLIRLKTKNNSIMALRKMGKNKSADKLQSIQNDFNISIIIAFREYFNFCPVYFFFSDYSKYVKEKKFEKVVFLNNNLEPDSGIRFTGKSFLTAEFGIIEADTSKNFAGYYYVKNKNGVERKAKYYGGTNMGFGALIIMSDELVQLSRPFPYYIRTFDSLWLFERSTGTVVKKLNKKLNKFYNKVN